jgi:palmitoyltransferase
MSSGIFFRFGYFVLVNRTTIEELGKAHPSFSIAVRISPDELPRATQTVGGIGAPTFWAVPYPFRSRTATNGPDTPQPKEHLYAILQPRSGANPWDAGYMRNWRNVMGKRVWDWFVPLRLSPCTRHDDPVSDYPLGKDFEDLEKAFLPHRYNGDGKRLISLRR